MLSGIWANKLLSQQKTYIKIWFACIPRSNLVHVLCCVGIQANSKLARQYSTHSMPMSIYNPFLIRSYVTSIAGRTIDQIEISLVHKWLYTVHISIALRANRWWRWLLAMHTSLYCKVAYYVWKSKAPFSNSASEKACTYNSMMAFGLCIQNQSFPGTRRSSAWTLQSCFTWLSIPEKRSGHSPFR